MQEQRKNKLCHGKTPREILPVNSYTNSTINPDSQSTKSLRINACNLHIHFPKAFLSVIILLLSFLLQSYEASEP